MDIIEKVENTNQFNSPEDVRSYIFALDSLQFSPADIIDRCESKEWRFKEGEFLKKKIVSVLVTMSVARPFEKLKESEIVLYKEEKEILDLIEDPYRWLVYSLLLHSKFDNHPTGWIKYTSKMIDGFLGHQSRLKSVSMMRRCCDERWIELRVVGSKNPITCYKVIFRKTEGEEFMSILQTDDLEQIYKRIWQVIR